MSATIQKPSGLREIWNNLRATPRRIMESTFRGGKPFTDRARSNFIFGNVFLHLHPVTIPRIVMQEAWSGYKLACGPCAEIKFGVRPDVLYFYP